MPYIFPILGGSNIEQLQSNIAGLKVALSDAQIKEIEGTVPFDRGFPIKYIVSCSLFHKINFAEASQLFHRVMVLLQTSTIAL